MSTGKVALGTLAGLAIGAITGVLLAPEKGSTTRKQIKGKKDDLVDKLKSKHEKFSDSVTEKFESTKNDAEELVDKGKAKFDEVKHDVKNASTNIKNDFATHNNNNNNNINRPKSF